MRDCCVFGAAGWASRLMPKRFLPGSDFGAAAAVATAASSPAIMSCTTASGVDCEKVPIAELTASAACGAWNPAGISHFGWCGVSSQHDGSSPSGAAISPAAERCQARLRYASLTAGNDSESDGKSSTPVMSVADFAPPPRGRDISIVFVFVSCSFTVKTCSTRRARGWLKVEG